MSTEYDRGFRAGYSQGFQEATDSMVATYGLDMQGWGPVPMARGGIVTRPTIAMLGERGPEAVIPLQKVKRKASAYSKRVGREIKRLNKAHKTKAGKWKKGWSQKRLMKAAHKAAKR